MNELLEVGIVTQKIAESLEPLPDTPPLLVAIHKKYRKQSQTTTA